MDTKFYNRNEMEERLPDYIFGRLPKDEVEIFEFSLMKYPDLVQEIEDVRKVFSKLERANIDAFLDKKTRNIPFKVTQKLQQKKNPLNIFAKPAFATIVAGFAVILIAISIFVTNKRSIEKNGIDQGNQSIQVSATDFPQLDSLDELAQNEQFLLDKTTDLSYAFVYESGSTYEPFNDLLDNIVKDQMVDLLDNGTKATSSLFDYGFYNHLEKLDENDFQQIIEELKDVKL